MGQNIEKAKYFQTIGYTPHPKQWLYHNSEARFRVPVCGRRFGKSMMAGKDLQPDLFLPNQRFWIVGPTYDLGEKEFRVIWDDLIIAQQLGKDKRIKKAYNKRSGDMYIEFPWKTRLEVRSADHPENPEAGIDLTQVQNRDCSWVACEPLHRHRGETCCRYPGTSC